MKSFRSILSICCLLAAICAPGGAGAAEPTESFLEALIQRRYFDEALVYLDQMAESPLASEEFRQSVPYRQGLTLIESARFQRDTATRQRHLIRAQEKLDAFLERYPSHPLVTEATSQLATIYTENARIQLAQAANQVGGEKESSYETARGLFDQAKIVFEMRLAQLREELEAIPKQLDPATDQETIERQGMLRVQYVISRLTIAVIVFEKSETYDEGSEERVALLEDAAELFKDIAFDYRNLIRGQYAKLRHGRCMQALGRLEDALIDYEEILNLTDESDDVRRLQIHALHLAMECWVDDSQKNYAVVVERGTQVIDIARPQEIHTEHWLAVRYFLALASKRLAETDDELSAPNKDRLLRSARLHAVEVAENEGEYQEPAQTLLAELTGGEGEVQTDEAEPDPQTFAEAKECGDEANGAMQSALRQVHVLDHSLSRTEDEARRAEMLQEKESAEQTIADSRQKAAHCYELAIRFADSETPLEDLNRVRYLLAYHMYASERYYDAAVLAEFIAVRFPQGSGGRKCAAIAMVSYHHLYIEAKEAQEAASGGLPEQSSLLDPDFAADHIVSIADYLVQNWPQEPEGQNALITLVRFLVQRGELEKAIEYLQDIDVDGSNRGQAELILGRALWSRYKQGLQATRDVAAGNIPSDQAPDLADLEATKQLAEDTLAAGIERMKDRPIDGTLVGALLALTEIYIDTGQPEKAIDLLEDETYGLLMLLREEHEATKREHFASAVYRAALRAYIAAAPNQGSPSESDAMMTRATMVMSQLKTVMRESPDGSRRLISLYLSLASDIKLQLELVQDPSRKESLARAFETFLTQIAENSNDKSELTWVADSFQSVGDSFEPGDNGEPPAFAVQLYDQAARQFNRILQLGQDGEIEISPGETLQIRVRLASALRASRQFEQAIDQYEAILRKNHLLLEIQIEAAQTYQDWAASGIGEPNQYNVAITGDRWDDASERNIIWGWQLISRRTAGDVRWRDTFYRARYNWALCNLEYAEVCPPDERVESLEKAENTIISTDEEFLAPALTFAVGLMNVQQMEERSYAQQARPMFHELMKRVQRGMDVENPSGLPPL